MVEYLTSSEALLALSAGQPSDHVKGGLKNLAVGSALTAGGVLIASQIIPRYDLTSMDSVWALVSMGVSGFGFYKIADGVTSFLDPLLPHTRDGTVYHRNGGYTLGHTRFDRYFGSKVLPIDDSRGLSIIRDRESGYMSGELFVNGVTLVSKRLKRKETKKVVMDGERFKITRWVDTRPEKVAGPLPAIDYKMLLTVEFGGEQFPAKTENSKPIKFLARKNPGDALRLTGEYFPKSRFEIKDVGEALAREAATHFQFNDGIGLQT